MKFNFIFLVVSALPALVPGRPAFASTPPHQAADGGDAQRLVALLDYVAADYPRAVRDGRVVEETEYQEQRRFAEDVSSLAATLLGPVGAGDPLLARVEGVRALVEAKAPAEAVSRACLEAREQAVVRFAIVRSPSRPPSLERAAALYGQSCAACHGERGDAATARARELDPAPLRFQDESRRPDLSPYRVYNALTFGVRGTAMPAFDGLTPAERWDLAFYVMRLGHASEPAGGPRTAVPLAELAARSDRELLEALTSQGSPAPAGALAWLRREEPFRAVPASASLDDTRRAVREALAAFEAGRPRDSDRRVLDAYLGLFEPAETRLRVRDPEGTRAAEEAFLQLRGAIGQGDAAQVSAAAQRLDGRLASLAEEGRRPTLPFLAAVLIYLREGLEAALLVGALLAGLARLGRPDAARYVHAGWIAALPAGVLTWWVSSRLLSLTGERRELLEACVGLLAAVVLFSASFWMISKAASRRWTSFLRERLEAGLSRRNLLTLSGLAFLAVYREAAETVLFTQALQLESPGASAQVWAGAAAGLLGVVALALAMSRAVSNLPVGPFFAVSSVLLCGLAVSFTGAGIHELVAGGYLKPRPVAFPEIGWLGVHPDLTGLLVQLPIVAVVAAAGLLALRRGAPQPSPAASRRRER